MAEIDFQYSIRVVEDKWPTIFLTLSGIDQFPFSKLEREKQFQACKLQAFPECNLLLSLARSLALSNGEHKLSIAPFSKCTDLSLLRKTMQITTESWNWDGKKWMALRTILSKSGTLAVEWWVLGFSLSCDNG